MTDPVMKIIPPYTPELLLSAQQVIANRLRPDDRVMELGSGWSTVWFAHLGVRLSSIEHDEGWFNEVDDVLRRLKLRKRVMLIQAGPEEFAEWIDMYRDGAMKLVYVDCVDEARLDCVKHARKKVSPDGCLVIDDSHWTCWLRRRTSCPVGKRKCTKACT